VKVVVFLLNLAQLDTHLLFFLKLLLIGVDGVGLLVDADLFLLVSNLPVHILVFIHLPIRVVDHHQSRLILALHRVRGLTVELFIERVLLSLY